MFAQFRFDAKRSRDETPVATTEGSADAAEEEHGRRVRVKAEAPEEPTEPATEPAAQQQHKWQERWHGICTACFEARVKCEHHVERRLRLLIVGHNPSDHAWMSGFSYSNPSNRFWNLLRGSLPPLSWRGILPADALISEQNHLPHVYGVGLTSIGLEPGNDAASYGKATMAQWRDDFFRRLRRHVQHVCANEHGTLDAVCSLPHSPMIIAFSGKRQFSWLFSPPLAKVDNFGRQTRLPQGWPRECLDDCEVWVLPSSSGRAAMTTEQRALPYQQLADRFHELTWPDEATIKAEVKLE